LCCLKNYELLYSGDDDSSDSDAQKRLSIPLGHPLVPHDDSTEKEREEDEQQQSWANWPGSMKAPTGGSSSWQPEWADVDEESKSKFYFCFTFLLIFY
jgi:hypothetical protein